MRAVGLTLSSPGLWSHIICLSGTTILNMHTASSLQLLVSLKIDGIAYKTSNSMELSPTWAVTNRSGTQEILNILWNNEVYYRVQKSPPLVTILIQMNIVHTTPTHFNRIYFNIILPPISRGSLSLVSTIKDLRSGKARIRPKGSVMLTTW
jgi:hypothetical protein